MNGYDVNDIKRYILYLKRECGLYVTLHPFGNESVITHSELITFNIHDNPYCVYVKTFEEAHNHCVERQDRIIAKCAEGSFCGSCYAGVKEYVYPITSGSEVVGFISVSGFKTENFSSFLQRASERYTIPIDSLREVYSELSAECPLKEDVDTLIMPLCSMLELAYLKNQGKSGGEEETIDGIIRYVKQHHTQNITLEDVCERFFCSRSFIGHNFKNKTGKSFREYLTEMRLEDAVELLRYSKLNVTEIALSVGFGDSAYFSNVFKRRYGVSPSEYRKL